MAISSHIQHMFLTVVECRTTCRWWSVVYGLQSSRRWTVLYGLH